MNDLEIIVLMNSVHEHMAVEDKLEKLKIPYKTVVKPRQLGTDCGMALKVDYNILSKVIDVCKNDKRSIYGVFKKENGVWEKFDVLC